MVNKWVVDCAGGCGRRLKRGPNSLPEPICRTCRKKRRVLICEFCRMPFKSKSGRLGARFCCIAHANRFRGRDRRLDPKDLSGVSSVSPENGTPFGGIQKFRPVATLGP